MLEKNRKIIPNQRNQPQPKYQSFQYGCDIQVS
jgi:hypothetical protein